LRQNGRFPITRLPNTRAPPQLANIPPGTIIYDRDQMDETAVYQLLSDYPGWHLVGLTASKEKVLIISSEKRDGRSLTDIIKEVTLLRATAKA
jgi:hypothetical protein